MKKVLLGKISALAFLSLSLVACQKDLSSSVTETTPEVASAVFKDKSNIQGGITFYALSGTTLDRYSTSNPEMILGSATITGLQSGERVLAIDFRPKTGQLYALGSNSRVYIVNPSSGVATFAFSFTSNMNGMPVLLSGSSFGFDFNPQVDRLRIISNTGQNLRVVPDGAAPPAGSTTPPVAGTTFVDGSININGSTTSGASVNAVAYDNNIAGTPSTELYALDMNTDLQYEIKPPNNGTLIDPLALNLDITGDGGFDIAPRNANVTTDIGLAIYDVNNKSTLFMIDVETGKTTVLAIYKRNNGNHFGNDNNKSRTYSALTISPAL